MKFKKPTPLVMPSLLPLLLILASCSIPTIPPPAVTTQTGLVKPLACTEFAPLSFSEGKPGATAVDVEGALRQGAATTPSDPLAWVRAVVGDTRDTRAEIDVYAAKRMALGCDP